MLATSWDMYVVMLSCSVMGVNVLIDVGRASSSLDSLLLRLGQRLDMAVHGVLKERLQDVSPCQAIATPTSLWAAHT